MQVVLYGSEAGNSADLADLTVDRLRRTGSDPILMPFGDASFSLLENASLVVIVCSTTGQGALPMNTKPFWPKLLHKTLSPTLFANLKFATFGLGDTSYPRYNWAIKKIHNRLLQLGATEFIGRGEGDEQSSDGIDFIFRQWLDLLLAKLDAVATPVDVLLPSRYSVSIENDRPETVMNSNTGISRPLPVATVLANDQITAKDHFQDVRHITLDLPACTYQPGDVLCVYPANRKEHVDALLEDQNWQDVADKQIKVDDSWAKQAGSLVTPLTIRSLLTWHIDLNGIPRRGFFAIASHFAQGREAEKMAEFGNGDQDALQDLYDYANRPRRSLIETILEFNTLQIPIEYILDVFPLLRPRQFSIASEANDPHVDLTVAVVKYKTVLHRVRRGICTDWLQKLNVGDQISVKVEPTGTKLLKYAEVAHSIVCVATGTGIAPIRSLVKSYKGTTPIYLFFGCRYKEKDFIYAQEWERTNVKVICAFSREGGSYVQQQIAQHSSELKGLLPGALIYVCGSAGKMPVGVREAFCDIAGEELITLKEKQGLYLQETY